MQYTLKTRYQHCFIFDDHLSIFLVGKFKSKLENSRNEEKLTHWKVILAEVRVNFEVLFYKMTLDLTTIDVV